MRKLYMKTTSALHRLLGKALAVVALSVATVGTLHAQDHRVSGIVTDANGDGAIGVTVVVKGDNTRAAITGLDGAYTITTRPDDVLVFSHVGYQTREMPVSGRATVDVRLVQDATVMEDVIVTGYGSQKRQFVVGSVSQVSNKELNITAAPNVSNMVAGKLPGITSIQRSGQPGKNQAEVLVRGVSTFNDSHPLVLVDGIPRDWNMVNPQDIDVITILKDAATTSLYGVNGANGVILVTTKTGARGEATITYNGGVTFSTNTAMPEMLNARDYMDWHNLARSMDQQVEAYPEEWAPLYTPENIQRMKDLGIYGETDWMSLIFKPFGLNHNHTVSATGGTDRIRYYASVGMMNEEGIIPNTSHRRFNVRSNIDVNIAKNFNLKLNLSGYHNKKHEPGFGGILMGVQNEFSPITLALYSLPNLKSTFTDPETGEELYMGNQIANGTTRNPLGYLYDSGYVDEKTWRFEGNALLEYDFGSIAPLKGLKAGIFVAYDLFTTGKYTRSRPFDMFAFNKETLIDKDPMTGELVDLSVARVVAQGTDSERKGGYEELAAYGDNIMLRPTLTYNREFGRHSVDAMVLYEMSNNNDRHLNASKRGYYSEFPMSISFGETWDGVAGGIYASGSFKESASVSVLGRFNYAYDRKYLAQVTLRADASYKFAPENRWGYFPSVSLGWVMSEEKFIKDAGTPIDFLKVKTSYGESGKDDTDAFLYMPVYASTLPKYSYVLGANARPAYYVSNYVYRDLTWSTLRGWNVGFEAELWRGKLGIEFEWFYKVTSNILEDVVGSYSPSLGGNHPSKKNSGKTDNRGFELVLKHDNRFPNGWAYSLKGSVSWARNRLLAKQMAYEHSSVYQRMLGEPMNSIYGLRATGLYQTQEQIDNSPVGPRGPKRLGDLMYEDINGDGQITAGDERDIKYLDYVKIGNSTTPELIFSLNMNVTWKGLGLTALWYGAAITSYQLTWYYNARPEVSYPGWPDATMYTRPFYANGNAPYYLVENSWREDNRDAQYPRLSTNVGHSNNAWPSSWWIKNGAYLRLRELALSYDLPENLLKRAGIKGARITLSGQNLFTISAFKYVDPEMPSVNNGYYPQQRTYTIGLDLTF